MTSNKKMKTLSKTNMCYEKIRLWCVKMTPPRKSSVPLSFKKEYHVSPLLGKFSLACSLKKKSLCMFSLPKSSYACSPCQKIPLSLTSWWQLTPYTAVRDSPFFSLFLQSSQKNQSSQFQTLLPKPSKESPTFLKLQW